jgi:hypothetical protein
MSVSSECTAEVRVDGGPGGNVTISVAGVLDRRTGRLLMQAADASAGCSRITVDLSGIGHFTEAGIEAAIRCCRTGAELPQGVSFVASAGPSREALLAILDRG